MSEPKKLAAYHAKRDFERSAEPSQSGVAATGDPARCSSTKGSTGPAKRDGPIFVCQRHAASSLHFDFRLEVDGLLVSWAIPKGPSTDPRDKRLAVRTEDHPLDYARFEGSIAAGEYGGGTVIVWDTGTYENRTAQRRATRRSQLVDMNEALEHGHLVIDLEGHKISGLYALTQTQMKGSGQQWLMVKMDDDHADRRRKPARTELKSVLSGRTNTDVEADER